MPTPQRAALLGSAGIYPGASVALDFVNNRYRLASSQTGNPANLPGWTFTRASTGYAETAAGALVAFASGAPRITDKGLLVEEARTNLLLRSQEFDNASWGKTNATVTADNTAAPDGTLTADKVAATASLSTTISQAATATAAASVFSIYGKKGSGATDANRFLFRNFTTATNLLSITVDWDTGVVTHMSGAGATSQQMANGWWRIIMPATSGITAGDLLVCYAAFNTTVETAGEFAYLWGAQLEDGAFPTSYIPTAGASATRAADVPVLAYSPTIPITLVMWATPNAVSTVGSAIYMLADDASSNNRIRLYNDASFPNARMLVTVGGATQASLANTAVVAGSRLKMAARAEVNNAGLSVNGGAVITDVSCTMPATTRITAADANAYIERWLVYPSFSDAQLQAATS